VQIKSSVDPMPERALFRILSHLKRNGLLDQGRRGDPYTITEKGLEAIKDYHRTLRALRAEELSHGQTTETVSPDSVLSDRAADQKAQLSRTDKLLSSTAVSPTVSTDKLLSPPPLIYIYKGGDDSVSNSDSTQETGDEMQASAPTDELFPEGERQPSATFDAEWAAKMLAGGNLAAVLTHYRIHRSAETRGRGNDEVLELARTELEIDDDD
jgi:hypothetical protein